MFIDAATGSVSIAPGWDRAAAADTRRLGEVPLVSDEAYHRLVYPGHTLTSALEVEQLRDRTVYVRTFSKTYAMTGWRWGASPGRARWWTRRPTCTGPTTAR
nr:aminotransferase class I/II-fold pyridoxal phosphate-dependent enzyme [Streptomyces armeniacus]